MHLYLHKVHELSCPSIDKGLPWDPEEVVVEEMFLAILYTLKTEKNWCDPSVTDYRGQTIPVCWSPELK